MNHDEWITNRIIKKSINPSGVFINWCNDVWNHSVYLGYKTKIKACKKQYLNVL